MADAPSAWVPGARANFRHDVPASLVVFLVALPLCLGIALASGAPLVAGLVSGVVGGLVVGFASGSPLSVSGPAAGLAVIVAAGIRDLGSWEAFLAAVVVSGVIQIGFGLLRCGFIANFVPQSVIKGMLAAIGIIIMLKQIPHALGRDRDFQGDLAFLQADHQNTFTELILAALSATPGPALVALISLAILLLWELPGMKARPWSRWVPGGLVVVIGGVALNLLFQSLAPGLVIASADHLVSLPPIDGLQGLIGTLTHPDPSAFGRLDVWRTGIAIALVGSIESLLSVEAADKLDPLRRSTPKNRELVAQGVGNVVAGLLGGLPVTAVIVRSSANAYAGARTRTSAVLHAVFLLGAILLVPALLNRIPLASLAAILIMVGYKLAKVDLFRTMIRGGAHQWLPFGVTVVAIIFSDLLVGVGIGILVGVAVILATDTYSAVTVVHEGDEYLVQFRKDASFWHKARLHDVLLSIPSGTRVTIDAGRAMFVDHDITEFIDDFCAAAAYRNIDVDVRRLKGKEFRFRQTEHVRG